MAVQGQIELLENGKKTVCEQDCQETDIDEDKAPIDDADLEVDRQVSSATLYRLHSVNNDRTKESC